MLFLVHQFAGEFQSGADIFDGQIERPEGEERDERDEKDCSNAKTSSSRSSC
jgi:hypothetical protein